MTNGGGGGSRSSLPPRDMSSVFEFVDERLCARRDQRRAASFTLRHSHQPVLISFFGFCRTTSSVVCCLIAPPRGDTRLRLRYRALRSVVAHSFVARLRRSRSVPLQ
uniref:Uncharacterized protein n=1 Tax=Plectus sambesii TaxID=2011161 RepID=A0A914X9Q9_9BILA